MFSHRHKLEAKLKPTSSEVESVGTRGSNHSSTFRRVFTSRYSKHTNVAAQLFVKKNHSDNHYVSPQVWGHKYWSIIQILALTSTRSAAQRALFFYFLQQVLPHILPCNMCKLNYMIHTTLQGRSELYNLVMNAKDAVRRAKLIAFVFDMRVKVVRSLFLSVKRTHRIQESFIFRVLGIHVPISGQEGLSAILAHANRIENVITSCDVDYVSYKDDLWYFLNLTSFIFPSGEVNRTQYDVMESTKAFRVSWLFQNIHGMLPEKHRRFASKLIKELVSYRGLKGGSKQIDISESISNACFDRSSIIVLLYSMQRELACRLRKNSNAFQQDVLHIMQSSRPVWMRRKGGMKRSNYSLAYHCELFKNLIYLSREPTAQTAVDDTTNNNNNNSMNMMNTDKNTQNKQKSKEEFAMQQYVSDNLVEFVSETLPASLYRLISSSSASEELKMCRLHKHFEKVATHTWSRSCAIQEQKRLKFALNIIESRASPKQDNVFNALRSLYATEWFDSILLRKIRRGRRFPEIRVNRSSSHRESDREVDRNLLMVYSKDSGTPQVQCMAYNYATGRRCKYSSIPCPRKKRMRLNYTTDSGDDEPSCLQFCELHSDYTLLTGLCTSSGKLAHMVNTAIVAHETETAAAQPTVDTRKNTVMGDETTLNANANVNANVNLNVMQTVNGINGNPDTQNIVDNVEELCSTLTTIKQDDDGTEMTKAYMLRIVCLKNYMLSLALLRLLVHDDVPTYVIRSEIVLPIAKPEIDLRELLGYIEDLRLQRRYLKMSTAFAPTTAADSNSDASHILRSVVSVANTPTSLYSLKMYPSFKKGSRARVAVLESGQVVRDVSMSDIITKLTKEVAGAKKQLTMQDILQNAINTST